MYRNMKEVKECCNDLYDVPILDFGGYTLDDSELGPSMDIINYDEALN